MIVVEKCPVFNLCNLGILQVLIKANCFMLFSNSFYPITPSIINEYDPNLDLNLRTIKLKITFFYSQYYEFEKMLLNNCQN